MRNFNIEYQDFKSPLGVHLELTSACNHKCIHCYNYWREPGDPIGTLSRDGLHRIIDNLIESDVQDIVITGGEPLLFPDLALETIDLAQKAHIKCFLNTNLTLLTNELAAEIRARGVSILTSFPSCDPTTFNEIVNKAGAFEKVIEGINVARAHDIHVTANMVVMQRNKDQILETGRFLHSIGISNFTATKVHPSQSCKNFKALQLKPAEVVSIFDSLLALREECGFLIDTLTCYPMCLFEDMKRYGSLLLPRSCTAGKTAAAIGADGGVRPCTHSDEIYGNAITESLLEIWPRMKEWRDGTYIPDACQQCSWVKACGAGCRMDSKYFHGTKDKPDPYMIQNDEFKIVMPDNYSASGIDDHQELFVNPSLRFREEEFGTFVTSGSMAKLVTKDSVKLLQSLSNQTFCLKTVVEEWDLNLEATRYFFTELVKEHILVTQSEKDSSPSYQC